MKKFLIKDFSLGDYVISQNSEGKKLICVVKNVDEFVESIHTTIIHSEIPEISPTTHSCSYDPNTEERFNIIQRFSKEEFEENYPEYLI